MFVRPIITPGRSLNAAAHLLLPLALSLCAAGCGADDSGAKGGSNGTRSNSSSGAPKRTAGIDPAEISLPEFKTGIVRVYTSEPGFYVFVDGEVARDEETGRWLTTPCAVTAPQGSHDVRVAKPGYRDSSQRVVVYDDSELVLEPGEDPLSVVNSVLDAPYLKLKVGKPIALESVNSPGNEADPFITPDGLALYYAADRAEGNGIYVATRSGPYVPFDPPRLLRLTRSFDPKATPSVTADSLSVVYALPERQRVVAATRSNPLAFFDSKELLRFSTGGGRQWRSAQMLADGLRLYWSLHDEKGSETRVATRDSRDDRFGPARRVMMPGAHPCLSADGLRQYVFDGKSLQRARRASVTSPFSRLETLHEFDLPGYRRHPHRRQYFVSEDQQWLFYSDDPEENGDLYMLRLSEGPGWGVAIEGHGIPGRQVASASRTPEPAEQSPEDDASGAPGKRDDPRAEVDPRTLPLPYTAHWKQFTALMASRNYAEAEKLVQEALGDPDFEPDRELLSWDRQDVQRVIGFWDDVRKGLDSMKPGDELDYGQVEVELVRFEDDTLVIRAAGKEVEKRIQQMAPVDLLALADRVVETNDQAGQLRMGAFLHYDPEGNARSARFRLERAGDAGGGFYRRLARRLLHQARQELERENIAAGLRFAQTVLAEFGNTPAADEAKQLEQQAYQFTKWNRRGEWQEGEPGEYVAPAKRSPNTFLVSPRRYENFELRLEWKITAPGGAGGAFFRYGGNRDPYRLAYKVHLGDDYESGRLDPQTTGALFNELPPTENAVRPRGQWNTLRLRCRGEQVQVEINGTKVFDRQVEADRLRPLSGYVMLEGVAGGITYRKTLLMELPPE